jgi:hypothetical protein
MAKSANLDFFAAAADQKALLDFLFLSTDVRVFESYSEFDSEIREFRSTSELASAFEIGSDTHGHGAAVLLQLWSPTVMKDLVIRRYSVDPSYCDGHTFRFSIEGGGLIQLYLGGVCGRVVTKSHYGHQSKVRAQNWNVDSGIDWDALQVLSRRIQYHIRRRLAVAKAGSYPVLPEALELAHAGYELKADINSPHSHDAV